MLSVGSVALVFFRIIKQGLICSYILGSGKWYSPTDMVNPRVTFVRISGISNSGESLVTETGMYDPRTGIAGFPRLIDRDSEVETFVPTPSGVGAVPQMA